MNSVEDMNEIINDNKLNLNTKLDKLKIIVRKNKKNKDIRNKFNEFQKTYNIQVRKDLIKFCFLALSINIIIVFTTQIIYSYVT
jgi:hypothetical protein